MCIKSAGETPLCLDWNLCWRQYREWVASWEPCQSHSDFIRSDWAFILTIHLHSDSIRTDWTFILSIHMQTKFQMLHFTYGHPSSLKTQRNNCALFIYNFVSRERTTFTNFITFLRKPLIMGNTMDNHFLIKFSRHADLFLRGRWKLPL